MLFQVLCGLEPIFYTTHPNEEPKIMADERTEKQKVQEITDKLEETLQLLMQIRV